MFVYLWQRFLFLGWVGKGVAVFAVLYGLGWIAGNLGAASLAHQLLSAALFVGSVLVTGLFIRLIWRNATAHHRK